LFSQNINFEFLRNFEVCCLVILFPLPYRCPHSQFRKTSPHTTIQANCSFNRNSTKSSDIFFNLTLKYASSHTVECSANFIAFKSNIPTQSRCFSEKFNIWIYIISYWDFIQGPSFRLLIQKIDFWNFLPLDLFYSRTCSDVINFFHLFSF
jgi:hypothetical protein